MNALINTYKKKEIWYYMQTRVGKAYGHVNLSIFYWTNEAYEFWDKCIWQSKYQMLREHDLSRFLEIL